MKKSKQLNRWLWKWHIIAGLVCVPVIALLCITGSMYLFKNIYNDYAYSNERFAVVSNNAVARPYTEQLAAAKKAADGHIVSVTLPSRDDMNTAFKVHAKGHARNYVYVNPYTNEVAGTYQQRESLMYTVRKLHGELLLGLPGTLLVELVASWFIVLALTGVYVWWPQTKFSLAGFFSIRTNNTRQVFWRDMHAVVGFWMSAFMLIILAGGLPWTEIFGDNLRWVQAKTDTGYPQHWRNSKGLTSTIPSPQSKPLSIDQVVAISQTQNLAGEITIKIPLQQDGVYTVSNNALWLDDQRVLHLDQYSGASIKALSWSQVGILMDLRQVFMRLHQGQYSVINLIVVLLIALTFFVATLASLISYLVRKPKGRWGLPKVPETFNAGLPVVLMIAILGLVFPAFGLSVLLIIGFEQLAKFVRKTNRVPASSQ